MKHFIPDIDVAKMGSLQFNSCDPYPTSFAIEMTDGEFVIYDKRTVQPRPHLFDGLTMFQRKNFDHPRKHEKSDPTVLPARSGRKAS